MKKFTWTVEFTVAETWVADGFTLTDERAQEMLATDLPYAYDHEIKATVVKHPDRLAILKAFGCRKEKVSKAIAEMPNGATALPNEIFDHMHGRIKTVARG